MDVVDPTLRGEHLGEELRALRTGAKLTLAEASKHIDSSGPTLSRLETGKGGVKFEDVAGLLAVYKVGGERRASLLAMALDADKRGWTLRTSHKEQIATLRRVESKATKIVNFEPLVMPGLLQTIPYMLALLNEASDLPEDEIQRRMTNRLQRQQVLRFPCPEFTALITENVLRQRVGGPAVLREQLKFLIEVAVRPKIHIRVLPNIDRAHPGLDGPYVRFYLPDRFGVVNLENRVFSQFLEEKDDVQAYDKLTEQLLALALDEAESVRFIAGIVDELEGDASS
ncbi:MAG TPA: helix-turn-helix transcriptional regulator [Pseudonocardiaceae bacterium]|jgi:transcriptional regulator with XRE-family HTH domain|nr:helix-turn-helix transcriptional regulator [Pseudonocardiaceae bacterium]